MVKQTKTFKKGNVTKKALSAILAASMVMTSSSFVMAAPVEVEDVAVEAAAVEEVAGVEEAVEASVDEELVGEASDVMKFKNSTFTFTGSPFTYTAGNIDDLANAFNTIKVERTHSNGTANDTMSLLSLIKSPAGDDLKHYTVKVVDTVTKKEYVLTASTVENLKNQLPTAVGTYKVIITGNKIVSGTGKTAEGEITSEFTINDDKESEVNVEFNANKPVYYTGSECKPSLKLSMGAIDEESGIDRVKTLTEGKDYDVVGYSNNINACPKPAQSNGNDPMAEVEVLFKGQFAARGTVKYGFYIEKAVLTKENTSITIKNPKVVYNGKEQKADVEVKFTPAGATEAVTLKENKDYTLNDSILKDFGKKEVIVDFDTNNFDQSALTSNGEATADRKVKFEVTAQDFKETVLDVTVANVYVGEDNEPNVVVKDKATGQKIEANGNYTILYSDKQGRWNATPVNNEEDNVGTYSVKLIPTGNNFKSGTVIEKNYKIVKLDADTLANYIAKKGYSLTGPDCSTQVAPGEFEYCVNGVVPTKITIDGVEYESDINSLNPTDGVADGVVTVGNIKVTFPKEKDCKALGEYKIKLEGLDVWKGDVVEITYKVVPKTITETNANTKLKDGLTNIAVYKTKAGDVYAKVALKDIQKVDGTEPDLVKGTDYDYEIVPASGNNYNVVINFQGNYKGTVVVTDAAEAGDTVPLDSDAVTAVVAKNYVYDSAKKEPKADEIIVTARIDGKDVVLRPGYDYKVDTYGDNIEVGEGTVTIRAISGTTVCSGSRVVKFQITKTETEKENYIVDTSALKPVYEYGTNFAPSIKVKTKAGRVLADGEYTVTYSRDGKEVTTAEACGVNAKLGTVTMKVTVNATKTDVLETSYRIATSLDKVTTIPSEIKDQEYTGSAIEPEIKLTKGATSIALEQDKDYTVTYSNNVNPGTATVTIQGIGDYYGTYVLTFKITGKMNQDMQLLKAQVNAIKSRTLNSKATVVKFEPGKENKTDVTYESSDENVVKVDETGKITYTGLGEATITIKAAETAEYKAAEATMTVKVGLAKPSFTPFSKNNAFTLTSSTVKGAQKFEVQYATKKDFSNKETKTFTTTNGKVRQVKVSAADKTTYYVRVRAISGTTKSAWSGVKTVATK